MLILMDQGKGARPEWIQPAAPGYCAEAALGKRAYAPYTTAKLIGMKIATNLNFDRKQIGTMDHTFIK